MRLHRFFIEEQLRNKKDITIFDDEIIHQLKDVFRMHSGDKLILLDNSGFEYLSEIVMLAKGKAEIKIIEATLSENIPKKELWLFASLIKKDNFEWIIEKLTELGVSHIVPVISDRTEKKDLNQERALKIIKEASEQSGRGMMPELHEVVHVKNIFEIYTGENISFIAFHTEGELFKKENLRKRNHLEKSLGIPEEKINFGVLIGPEGGWSDHEIALFKEKNIPLVSLGNQILRAETAAIVISALFLF